ncbi:hypothetical protein LRY64_00195 [Candidatus Woesebacteria bacterium]|nr:hypothetical protein [Candidatus Woesebacteria bacterium]
MTQNANEKGVFFSAISPESIEQELMNKFPKLETTQFKVELPENIKNAGKFKATVSLKGESMNLNIDAQEEVSNLI